MLGERGRFAIAVNACRMGISVRFATDIPYRSAIPRLEHLEKNVDQTDEQGSPGKSRDGHPFDQVDPDARPHFIRIGFRSESHFI